MKNKLLHTQIREHESYEDMMVRIHKGLVVSVITKRFKNLSQIWDDLVLEGMEALLMAIRTWDAKRSLPAYIYSCVYHRGLNYYRVYKRHAFYTPIHEIDGSQAGKDDYASFEELSYIDPEIRNIEDRYFLEKILKYIPKRDYGVLVDNINGKSVKEIAREQGVSRQAINFVKLRAQKRIADLYHM